MRRRLRGALHPKDSSLNRTRNSNSKYRGELPARLSLRLLRFLSRHEYRLAEVEFCSSTTRFGDFCRQFCQTSLLNPFRAFIFFTFWTGLDFRFVLYSGFERSMLLGLQKSSSKIDVQPRGCVKLRAPDASTTIMRKNYCSMLNFCSTAPNQCLVA